MNNTIAGEQLSGQPRCRRSSHSIAFLRGTGKSNLVANIATLLAQGGQRVGVVDLDESAPTLHLIFGLPECEVSSTLGDFLAGRCPVQKTAYEVTPKQLRGYGGRIFLVPLSIEPGWMPKRAAPGTGHRAVEQRSASFDRCPGARHPAD